MSARQADFQARMDNLRALLRCAMTVELTTIPAYLTASFSLEDGAPGVARNVVARELLRSVLVEEMLHLTLVANILNAVGGRPALDCGDWVPAYPTRLFPRMSEGLTVGGRRIGASRPLIVHLRRFCPEQVEAFRMIEQPEIEPTLVDGEGAGDIQLRSIGEFYAALAAELRAMVEAYGEAAVFCGDPARQAGPEYYYAAGGALTVIDGAGGTGPLHKALAAIKKISEEGEGLPEDHNIFDGDVIPGGLGEEPAHFFRFREILEGRRYRSDDKWGDPPSGDAIVVDWDAVWPTLEDPNPDNPALPADAAAAMRAFDAGYSDLLRQINAALDGRPELLRDAVHGMFALKHRGVALMRLRLPDGRTAGPAWRFTEHGG